MAKTITHDIFLLLKLKLQKHKTLPVRIVTGSMLPLIKIDENIWVEPPPPLEELKRFDILVYWSDDKFICHYLDRINDVINSDQKVLILKGLKNKGQDFPVYYENLFGKVNMKIPWYLRLWR